ncbi:MAG: hypothetical protein GX660_19450 [Clostridiaceae bacterium]|nr:hypothetical protein [Clostridiaceae bacterium]
MASALNALGAIKVFEGLTAQVKSGIDAFNKYNNSIVGLKSIVQGTGNDFSKAQKFIEEYTSDGLISAAEAATALKNLLSRGYTQTQAEKALYRLKDAAAFGRQSSLELGQAVASATEGLKNENSTLVDNAGVTKNVSKMWDEYAATIGKTRNELTQAEKIQAEYNGIMTETRFQVGDAAKLTSELFGSQAKLGQSVQTLKKSFGEALAPAVKKLYDVTIPLIQSITKFIENNKELTVTLTAVTMALSGTLAVTTSFLAAMNIFMPTLKMLMPVMTNLANVVKVLNMGLAGATVVWGSMIAAVGAGVHTIIKAKNETEELKNNYEDLQEVLKKGISKQDAEDQFNFSKAQEYLVKLKKYKEQADKLTTTNEKNKLFGEFFSKSEWEEALTTLKKFGVEIGTMDNIISSADKNINSLADAIAKFEKEQEIANRTTADAVNNQLKDLAIKKRTITETENLIETYKNAKQGSKEWIDAEEKLAEIFPQFTTLNGIRIDAITDLIKSEKIQTNESLKNINSQIEGQKKLAEAALLRAETEAKLAKRTFLLSDDEEEREKALKNVEQQTTAIKELKNELTKFDALKDIDINNITGITPVRTTNTGKKDVEKTAYEKAIDLYQHRKNLGQLTLEDEINILSQIKNAHAKTADEIWDIEEKLYDAQKTLDIKRADDVAKKLQTEINAMKKRTQNSDNWIARQKMYNKINESEEIAAYNRIITYHKEHLAKIEADEKISVDEKNKIREDEFKTIQDYEDKIYNVKKQYIDEYLNEYFENLEDEVAAAKKAEMKKLADKKEAIEKKYKLIDEAKEEQKRNEKLAKLREDEKKRVNAVTREGLEELADIRKEIAELEEDAEEQRLEKQKENEINALDKRIKETETKYEIMINDMKSLRKQMETEAYNMAENVGDSMVSIYETIAKTLTNITKSSTGEMKKIVQDTISETSKMKVSIENNNIKPAASTNSNVVKYWELDKNDRNYTEDKTMSVTINDYGNKILNNKEDVKDYTLEIADAAKNALAYGY